MNNVSPIASRRPLHRAALLAVLALAGATAAAQGAAPASPDSSRRAEQLAALQPVSFDSLDRQGLINARAVPIRGYLLAAAPAADGPAPAAVLNPACDGLLAPESQQVRARYLRMASHLQSLGMTVLLVDGFNPRGFSENCSDQRIDDGARLRDALGGLAYLRARPEVDPGRVAMVAWGNAGGMEGMRRDGPAVGRDAGFAAAALYYPECRRVRTPFDAYAPVQVFGGALDQWNPVAPCKAVQGQQPPGSAPLQVTVYPDAYHAFDTPVGQPQMNRYHPRLGMVGRNDAATRDSYLVLARFLADAGVVRTAPVSPPPAKDPP